MSCVLKDVDDRIIVGCCVSSLITFPLAVIALGIFCFVTRRGNAWKEETLIDSYNDVRETIYNYDEEGMPEEDQDGYDISRLSKPINDGIRPVLEKPLGRAPPCKSAEFLPLFFLFLRCYPFLYPFVIPYMSEVYA